MGEFMSPQAYNDLRKSMCKADPRLKDPKHGTWFPWHRARPRVVALHQGPDGSFGSGTQYEDPDGLWHHFQHRKTSKRSVYILEGLSLDFTAVLGCQFRLHPSLFMDHERLVAFNGRATGEGNGIPYLPSAIHSRGYVSLKYHEPLVLSNPPMGFRNLCDLSGRHIAVTRLNGCFSDVAIARRKCTFWSRKNEEGGWDCLIICDPPIKRVLTDYSGNLGYNVTTSPYNGGYLDFIPHGEQKRGSGPPRSSFLGDIKYYLETHSDMLDLSDPCALRVFAEKIVACHYLKVAEFLQTVVEMIQFNFSRRQDMLSFAIAAVEEQWSDVQALERRIGEYQDDLEAIMLQLQVPLGSTSFSTSSASADIIHDYQYLYRRLKEISQRISRLNGSTAALAGLANNRQAAAAQEIALQSTERSISEANSVKVLTILGGIFIPLAYTASLFSMSDSYRPGERLFWVYFATAIPLIALVFLGYYILELGHGRGGIQWSLSTAIARLKND